MGDFSLVFAVVGSVIFGLWLAFEVWIRRAPVEEVAFTTSEEQIGSETAYYRARVQIPSSYQINEKWVWISAAQYESLEGTHTMPVHIRRSGNRIFLRGVHHRGWIWWSGLIALYFGFNLIIIVFDL